MTKWLKIQSDEINIKARTEQKATSEGLLLQKNGMIEQTRLTT